jgi:hypothetical protein
LLRVSVAKRPLSFRISANHAACLLAKNIQYHLCYHMHQVQGDNGTTMFTYNVFCVCLQSWAAVDADGSRYLLSDFAGGLHLLVLAHADNRVAGLKVQTLGE